MTLNKTVTVQKQILNLVYARLSSGKEDKNSILDCNKQEQKLRFKNQLLNVNYQKRAIKPF